MKHKDLRTRDQKICDMMADEKSFGFIAERLQEREVSIRARWHVICAQVGERP